MLGYTVADRHLFTVYVIKTKGIARVITSMDMDAKKRKSSTKEGANRNEEIATV